MTKKVKRTMKFTRKTMMVYFFVSFLVCTTSYVLVHMWENNSRQELIKIGVAISKDISSQSGLPLLERNMTLLNQLIEKIIETPEVIFASIVDHRNQLIAYTDQDRFFSLNWQKSGRIEDVKFWRISDSNYQDVMNFSSDITFSGTSIGEVFISLASDKMGYFKRLFAMFSLLSLLVMAFLFGIDNYKAFLPWLKTMNSRLGFSKTEQVTTTEDPEFFCPLCGGHTRFFPGAHHLPDLGKFHVLKQYPDVNASVLLTDMKKKDELGRFKRLIIAQCTKIINKVAVE